MITVKCLSKQLQLRHLLLIAFINLPHEAAGEVSTTGRSEGWFPEAPGWAVGYQAQPLDCQLPLLSKAFPLSLKTLKDGDLTVSM